MKHDVDFTNFTARVHMRMEKGEQEYGDKSFAGPLLSTIGEVEEELLDVCGWAFVLWKKMRMLRTKAAQIDAG